MAQLLDWLKSCRKPLENVATNRIKLNIIMGNEAADTDSVVSAIALAYFLYKRDIRSHFLPIVNIKKFYWKLRIETQHLFSVAHLDSYQPTFTEEIPWQLLYQNNSLNLFLTDHNELQKSLSDYEDAVVYIIDHHNDNKKCLQVKDEKRNIVFDKEGKPQTVGSCCSLVTDLINNEKPELLVPPLSTLLLGAIMLDTQNLGNKSRTTPLDIEMANILIDSHHESETGFNHNKLYEDLKSIRFDEKWWCDELNWNERFNYDYKEYKIGMFSMGISGMLYPIHRFFKNDEKVENEVIEFMRVEGLHMYIIMGLTVNKDNQPKREIYFRCKDENLCKRVVKALTKSSDKYEVYQQKEVKISRKMLVPSLTDFLENVLL